MEQQDNLSLIPYSSQDSREVVLRHGSSIVLYDDDSKQVTLRNNPALAHEALDEISECPWCHRPFDGPGSRGGSASRPDTQDTGFMNPAYFRMLRDSREGSQQSSRDTSPRRRLVQPALADGSRRANGEHKGPTSAADEGGGVKTGHISSRAFSQGYFKDFFVDEGEIGRGGKGVVLLVRHVLEDVNLGLFACKRVPVGDNSEWLRKVLVEVQLLQNLSHQNIVSYKHVWLENCQLSAFGPSEVPCLFILQQFCDSGDLQQYVLHSMEPKMGKEAMKERVRRRSRGQSDAHYSHRASKALPFEEIVAFFRDITDGLDYLHSKLLIHRDLKPNNVLLHRSGSKIRAMVSDFGEMQGVYVPRQGTGATGTMSWCAPEVVRHDGPGTVYGNFTQKSDIFSLGLILYFMCFARLPYSNADQINDETEDIDQTRAEIAAWSGLPDELRRDRSDLPDMLYKVLKTLLSAEPEKRPSTREILHIIRAGSSSVGGGVSSENNTWRAASANGDANNINNSTSTSVPDSSADAPTPRSTKPSSPTAPSTTAVLHRRPSRSPPNTNSASSSAISPTATQRGLVLRRKTENDLPPPYATPLLAAPPGLLQRRRRRRALLRALRDPRLAVVARLALFAAKAYSVLAPCGARQASPEVMYGLLVLAAMEVGGFVGRRRSGVVTAGLAALHAGTVVAAWWAGVLCV